MNGSAFEGVEREEGFAARWEKMLPADRLVLMWVAADETDLHGAKSLARMGQALKLGAAADRQILIQAEIGVYRFEDETFRDWVQLQRPTTARS